MRHVVGSIRKGLASEQERIPDASESTADEHEHFKMDDDYGHDSMKQVTPKERRLSDMSEDSKGSISPALEACRLFKANENNMGPESHQKPTTWGWPGLGTFPEPTGYSFKTRNGTRVHKSELEPRVEAATFEAIDNAAESESFGWPGLGSWPRPAK